MKPFQLASGGTLLTQSPKLQASGLVNPETMSGATKAPMLRGPSTELIASKRPIQPIITSNLPKEIARTSGVLVEAAFNYEERLAQVNADETVLNFRKQARALFDGEIGEDGKLVGGYANTKDKEAMESLKGYRDSMDNLVNTSLESLEPSVRAKALLRIKGTSEEYVNQGISHYQRESLKREENLRTQDEQFLQQEISQYGAKPFLNGRVNEVLSRYTDEGQRLQAHESLVKNAVYDVYNKAHAAATKNPEDLYPAMTAQKAVVDFYTQIQPTVPVETDNKIYNWLENQNQVAQQQSKSVERDRQKNLLRNVQKEAPIRFGKAILEEDYESLNNDFQMYKSVQENPEVASDSAVKYLKEALFAATMAKGGPTYSDKKVYLESQAKKMLGAVELDPVEAGKFVNIVQVELPKMLHEQQNTSDQDALNEQAFRVASIRYPGVKENEDPTQQSDKMPAGDPPEDMLPENKLKWDKIFSDYEKSTVEESKGAISGYTPEKAQGLYRVYRDSVRDGDPLSEGQQDRLRIWLSEGAISPNDFSDIMKLNKATDTAEQRKPAFMKTEEYKAVLSTINETDALFAKRAKPAVKSGKSRNMKQSEDYYEWVREAEIGKANFRNELENANREAIKAGRPFSPHDFMRDRIKVMINSGQIATPPSQFMEFIGKEWRKGMEAPYKDSRSGIISGEQESIMDDFEL